MFDPKTIESQLRKLEANWQTIGEHLDDESIAAVIDGQKLSEEQAQHLLGCRECVVPSRHCDIFLECSECFETPAATGADSTDTAA